MQHLQNRGTVLEHGTIRYLNYSSRLEKQGCLTILTLVVGLATPSLGVPNGPQKTGLDQLV